MLDLNQNTTEQELVEEIIANEEVDFSNFSKHELHQYFDKNHKEGDVIEQYQTLKKLKPFVDSLFEDEKTQALDKFIANGGETDDFEFKGDAFFNTFENAYQKVKSAFHQNQKDLIQKKDQNYKSKLDILNQMKTLIEGGSVGKSGFEKFKTLQQDWKNTGQVPQEKSQELWSNYQAVVNRFYDLRNINFELLDLDRKRNLQAKQSLIEKAEKLANEPSIKKALKELEELHEEFKHIGPVTKELQDEIWNKFKTASDKVHEKKREYLEVLKSKFDESLKIKTALLQKLQTAAEFTSDKIEDWANQTKIIEKIQEEWKNAGLVDKDKVKEVNKVYWDTLKKFYNTKREFFKEIEKYKNENLKLKQELINKVQQLAESTDWNVATRQIQELQKEWKTIGHVPIKLKDKVYEQFKKACDSYFDAKRNAEKEVTLVNKKMLDERAKFVEEFQKLEESAIKSIDDVIAKIAEFKALAEVTGNEASKVYNKFAYAIKARLDKLKDISDIEKDNLVSRLLTEAMNLSPDGEKERFANEKKIRKDIRDIEDAIAQLKNNMEFFGRSKNAEAIKKDFEQKIKDEEQKLSVAKSRLNIILGK